MEQNAALRELERTRAVRNLWSMVLALAESCVAAVML